MITIDGKTFDCAVYETGGKVKSYNATFDLDDKDVVRRAFENARSVIFDMRDATYELAGVVVQFYHETPTGYTVAFSGITLNDDAESRLEKKITDVAEGMSDRVSTLSDAIDDILVMVLEG